MVIRRPWFKPGSLVRLVILSFASVLLAGCEEALLPAPDDTLVIDRFQVIEARSVEDAMPPQFTESLLPSEGHVSVATSGKTMSIRTPFRWRPHSDHPYLFRATIELNVPPNRLWSIYIPRIDMNAAVYFNGRLLGDSGSLRPLARNWNRAVYVTVPNGMFRVGVNTVDLLVTTGSVRPGLIGTAYLGPDELLRAPHDRASLTKNSLPVVAAAALFTVAALTLAIWVRRRRQVAYGLFALASALFALSMTDFFVIRTILSDLQWEVIIGLARLAMAAALTVLVCYFAGQRNAGMVRFAMPIAGVAGGCLLMSVFAGKESWGLASGVVAVCLLGLIAVSALLSRRDGRWVAGTALAGLLALCLFATAAWDLAVQGGWVTAGLAPITPPVGLVAVILAAWWLVKRFAVTMDNLEELNVGLQQKVDEKAEELEEGYRRAAVLERERILAAERDRMMRDMHDGLGGQLVTALALAQEGQEGKDDLVTALRTALVDMRLVIESLSPTEVDLTRAAARPDGTSSESVFHPL
jgi:signal transduction histidine kinase